MILGGRRVNLVLYFLIGFALFNWTQAKIYVFRHDPGQRRGAYDLLKRTGTYKNQNLLQLIKKLDDIVAKNRNTCLRLFGSMHGSKDERIRCLEALKKRKLEREELNAVMQIVPKQVDEQAFLDLTRGSSTAGNNSPHRIRKVTSVNKPNEFSTDYIDFGDLRSETSEDELTRLIRIFEDPKSTWRDFRKTFGSLKTGKSKKSKTKAGSFSSEESMSSEAKKSVLRTYKKLKRFQVVKNVGNLDNVGSSSSSSESASEIDEDYSKAKPVPNKFESSSSSEETPPKRLSKKEKSKHLPSKKLSKKKYRKPPSKKLKYYSTEDEETPMKNSKNEFSAETSFEDSGAKSKYVEPLKAKEWKKKALYLQGHNLLDLDGRRRIQNFLPKRFHWSEDDIPNLGYFWFNGPQGKYSYYPVRP